MKEGWQHAPARIARTALEIPEALGTPVVARTGLVRGAADAVDQVATRLGLQREAHLHTTPTRLFH